MRPPILAREIITPTQSYAWCLTKSCRRSGTCNNVCLDNKPRVRQPRLFHFCLPLFSCFPLSLIFVRPLTEERRRREVLRAVRGRGLQSLASQAWVMNINETDPKAATVGSCFFALGLAVKRKCAQVLMTKAERGNRTWSPRSWWRQAVPLTVRAARHAFHQLMTRGLKYGCHSEREAVVVVMVVVW